MNKYQEAFELLRELLLLFMDKNNESPVVWFEYVSIVANMMGPYENLETLQGLVSRMTPKKPIAFEPTYGETLWKCPNCKDYASTTHDVAFEGVYGIDEVVRYVNKHCSTCGQALDWSESKDKE